MQDASREDTASDSLWSFRFQIGRIFALTVLRTVAETVSKEPRPSLCRRTQRRLNVAAVCLRFRGRDAGLDGKPLPISNRLEKKYKLRVYLEYRTMQHAPGVFQIESHVSFFYN